MFLETNPIVTGSEKEQWIHIEDFAYIEKRNNLKFLYIGGDDELMQSLSNSFHSGITAESFAQARKAINKTIISNGKLPDTIFIDIPLNKMELESFCYFLNENNILSASPLIYNEKQLDIEKVKLLKHLELVDDVIDISSNKVNYPGKISFLKKIKTYQANTEGFMPFKPYKNSKGTAKNSKRVLDVIFAILAILILLPLFILIAIAIKLESKGPVIYTSLRAGKGFKVFKFYKFRTMEVNADKKVEALSHLNQYNVNQKGPVFFKVTNDPRVTKVGKFLRNTSLDELPQLLNVLIGDMSLVGNRPLPLYEAATLTTNEFVERFMAPAGITGLWQIKKRGKADMSTEERISLDIAYARNYSLLYDLRIMAYTPKALFQKSNV